MLSVAAASPAQIALLVVAVVACAVAAVTDLRRRIIPNGCVAVVAACGLASAATGGIGVLASALAGAAVVLAVLLVTAAVSARATGASGIGGGDVKLLAAAGLWYGPVGGLAAVAGSCLASLALWGLARLRGILMRPLSGNNIVILPEKTTVCGIPLGPGIALSFVAIALLGGVAA